MRKWLFLFALISMLSNVFAQNVIIGKITEKDGKALSGATVMVEDANTSGIKGYAISDGKGIYKLSFSSDASKLSVRVKAFNHKEKVQTVDNKSQTLNFSLELNFTEIKEIVLKNKLITKKGDTITYDLKSFSSKSNRTLADVLKKMPGMEVQSDGTVIYQGKPINKFNVNGKDLMEGAYGTVNNALPKDAVKDVQVMENHQPIKLLKDKVPSEQAALNIRLKRKITMTGRGEVSAGFSPFLWNVKLTPMFFWTKEPMGS